MSAQNVKLWYKTELVFEGGKVDDPRDPGGRTNQGVTQRVYNGWRKARGLPIRDVYLLEAAECLDIYKTNYWDKVWGDRLPDGLDVIVADGAINSGPGQSIKWLQRALGVRVDGIMGDATMSAINAVGDMDALCAKVIKLRQDFLRALKTFKTFGKGWLRRTTQLLDIGQHLATGSVGTPPRAVYVEDMNRKANLEDAKAAPPKLDALWGAGTGTGLLAQAVAALEPLQNIPHVATILSVLTAAGVLLGILGGVWAWYARQKTQELREALDLRPQTPDNDNLNPIAQAELQTTPDLASAMQIEIAKAA